MSFDLQPVLTGETLKLEPLRPDHYDNLYAAAADPLIWDQHPVRDRYKEESFQKFFREALESQGALAVSDLKTDTVIGSSRYNAYDPEKREIEIGWTFLARSHWGGPSNTEMKRLMLQHAFRFVDSVIFVVDQENHRSQKAVLKLGAKLEGSKLAESGRTNFIFRLHRPQGS